MRTSRVGLAALALAALAACAGPVAADGPAPPTSAVTPDATQPGGTTPGGTTPGDTGPGAAPPAGAADADVVSGAEEAAVEQTFRNYNEALLARDFAAACAANAPETSAGLIEALGVGSCEEAFGVIYADGAGEYLDAVVRSTTIQDIVVTGERATVSWSADGHTSESAHRRVDGRWLILPTAS